MSVLRHTKLYTCFFGESSYSRPDNVANIIDITEKPSNLRIWLIFNHFFFFEASFTAANAKARVPAKAPAPIITAPAGVRPPLFLPLSLF